VGVVHPRQDRAAVVWGAGLAVSVLLHAGVAWWLGVMPSRTVWFPIPPVEAQADPEDAPEPMTLGMDIPENASIAWLGVLENPIEAAAPESEVDQAELSPTPGAEPMPEVSPPELVEPVVEPVQEPAEPAPALPVERPVAEPPAEPVPQPEPEPVVESQPEEPAPLQPLEIPDDPRAPVVPPEVAEPVPGEPVPVDEPRVETLPIEPEPEPEPEPIEPVERGVMGPPEPTPEQRAAEEPVEVSPAPEPSRPTQRPPTPAGAPGELDERASDAAMRRTARELPIDRLGRPLQASGDLQLTTVRPTWSLQVRNAYSPRRNPFVEIRFGADGRVRWARFVPLADGTVGSGYEEVDQPLLNAVFRWTARGEAIEALRDREPGATHDIVMRFVLVSAVPGERDEE
jgi:hypothetical protein